MDGILYCNHKKCRKPLSSGQAWVTSCSHLFCPDDAQKFLVHEKKCPVCGHSLSGKLDIVSKELNPSEDYKSMVLCGLQPDIITDICSRAINFWMFQSHQDCVLKEHQLNRISEKYSKMEKYCQKMMSSWQVEAGAMDSELHKVKSELDSTRKRCDEVNELLREKSRQLQKLQSSFSAHRHTSLQRNLTMSPRISPRSEKKLRSEVNGGGRMEFGDFSIPIGTSRHTPPQRDANFNAVFFDNARSIPCSPYAERRLPEQSTPGNDEGLSRKLF